MVLKFAANLNFLFTEVETLVERIMMAHRSGFRAVEIPFPPKDAVNDVIRVKNDTGIEIALVNIALGPDGLRLGSACIPGAEATFKDHLTETINFAKAVNCKKIHIMSGLGNAENFDEYLKTYGSNLKYAAENLQKEGIVGVIEPINRYSVPSYFMNSYEIASGILREINNKHLKLMLDVFHMQHICGNITNSMKELNDLIGHFQIAQVPYRNEPDTAGELDYSYLFSLIEKSGYTDWIGCEYKPSTTTTEGLKWLSKYGFSL